MDLQVVSGVHGLAYYACSYIAKAEPDDLKQALSKVFEDISSHSEQYSLKKQMHLVGNCILKTRRLSAQEAAARLARPFTVSLVISKCCFLKYKAKRATLQDIITKSRER